MSHDPRDITLAMPLGGQGTLLTECARAYLHTGNPSVLCKRVLEGVVNFIIEKEQAVPGAEAGNRMDHADALILGDLRYRLEQMYAELKKLEDKYYGP